MKLQSLLLAAVLSVLFASVTLAAGQQEAPKGGETPESHSAPVLSEQDQDTVLKVQKQLKRKGYRVQSANGEWGRDTEAAVSAFQRAEGLNATGALDQDTLRRLGVEE